MNEKDMQIERIKEEVNNIMKKIGKKSMKGKRIVL